MSANVYDLAAGAMTAPRAPGTSSPPASRPAASAEPSCAAPCGPRRSRTPHLLDRPRGWLRRAAAAWLVAGGIAVAGAPAFGAELVSNLGEADDSLTCFLNDHAQPFTTGANSPGYRLTGVEVEFTHRSDETEFAFSIWSRHTSGLPGFLLGALRTPASVAVGNVEFTTDGIDLDPSTPYFVVIDSTLNIGDDCLRTTSSDNETATALGWTIGNTRFLRKWDGSETWRSLGSTIEMKVNGTVNVATVEDVQVTSTPTAASDTYGLGETIEVTVTFSDPVTVAGSPRFRLNVGGAGRWADYAGGSGGEELRFAYVVQAGDTDGNGIEITADRLALNGGTIQIASGGGIDADLDHDGKGTQGGHKVNGTLTPPAPNTPPEFDGSSTSGLVPENSPPDTVVTASYSASDADGDTLTYTLEGTDAASFDIDPSSGKIRTKSGIAYDHEEKSVYSMIVKADDGNGGTATIFVHIQITDVEEPPSAPAAPTVEAVADTSDSLSVSWTAPDNSGKPDIESYDLQYRKGTTEDWSDGPQDVAETMTTITGLDAGSSYQVRVRATNDEGNGAWSPAGTGSTSTAANADATLENLAISNATEALLLDRAFDSEVTAYTASVADATLTLKATPTDEDATVAFFLDAADMALTDADAMTDDFQVSLTTGLTTINVRVTAVDAVTAMTYTLAVTRKAGCAAVPTNRLWSACLTVGATSTSMTLFGYHGNDEGYFLGDKLSAAAVTLPDDTVATVNVLSHDNATGELRVIFTGTRTWLDNQANRGALSLHVGADTFGFGDGMWENNTLTVTQSGLTWANADAIVVGLALGNAAPTFTSAAAFSVNENQTAVGTVKATDPNAEDTVTYAITGGADSAQFQINETTGALSFKSAPDYENPADVASTDPANDADNNEYIVAVTATGGTGTRALTAAQTITVTVDDVDESEPAITLAFAIEGLDTGTGVVRRDEDAGTITIGLRAQTAVAAAPVGDFEVILRAVEQTAVSPGDFVAPALTYAFGAADFVLENGKYVLTVTKAIEIVDDEVVEKTQYFELEVHTGGLPGHVTIPSSEATVVVEIHDEDTTSVRLVENDVTVEEGEEFELTLAVDHDVAFPFAVPLSLVPTDGTGMTDRYLEPEEEGGSAQHWDASFPAAQRQVTLMIGTVEDRVQEADVSLDVGLFRAGLDDAIALVNDPVSTVTIVDDDEPAWTLSVDPATIAEAAGTATVTVSTGGVTFEAAQTIDLSFDGGSATAGTDFRVADADGNALTSPYALTLAEGESTVTATVTAVDDTVDDDDKRIQITATRNGEKLGETQSIAIADDDTASTGIELDLTPASVTENGGAQTIAATAALNGAARTTATDVTVSRTGGTATSGTDYAAVSDFTIVIPAASTSATGSFEFEPTDDNEAEGAETVILTASATDLSSGAATLTITDDDVANNPPEFADDSVDRQVVENSLAGVPVTGAVTAVDADGDTLTYSLEGADAASFEIDASTGQIRTKAGVTYDYESTSQYSVTVKADDGRGGTDTIAVTIQVQDVDEPPSAPTAVTVSAVPDTTDRLMVSWTAPENAGKPAIDSYNVFYRKTGSGDQWSEGPQDVTGTTATITGLEADTSYEVQVSARNDEGAGVRSASVVESTNAPPAVSEIDFTSDPNDDSRDGDDDTYAIGDEIEVTVTFSEAVTVGTSGGSLRPQLELRIVGDGPEHSLWAVFERWELATDGARLQVHRRRGRRGHRRGCGQGGRPSTRAPASRSRGAAAAARTRCWATKGRRGPVHGPQGGRRAPHAGERHGRVRRHHHHPRL